MIKKETKMSKERMIAYEVLYSSINDGRKLDRLLLQQKDPSIKFNQVYNLVMGVARNRYRLEAYFNTKLREKIPTKAMLILLIAGYELMFNNSAKTYAVISQALKLSEIKNLIKYKKLIHGVLSALIKELEKNTKLLERFPIFPAWMMKEIKNIFGTNTDKVIKQLSSEVPFFLSVNTIKVSVEELKELLEKKGIDIQVINYKDVKTLKTFDKKILDTAEFADGLFIIQDLSSQIAVNMLAPKNGMKILDLCSAPGSKAISTYIISNGSVNIDAVDKSSARLLRFYENINRMKIKNINIINADVMELDLQKESYDAILLDPPCTALGVSARNPDLIWSKGPEQIKELSELQIKMLIETTKYLKKGGRLVYSVCTFTEAETTALIEKVKSKLPEFVEIERFLTMPEDMDGMFISVLEKK